MKQASLYSSTDQGGGKRRVEDVGWKILNARSYYNGMKRKLIKTHKERWEQGLAALSKFRKRKRHCCPSRHHLEGKFKLGRWVNTQRYLKDALSVKRELARVSLGARLCSPFEVQTPRGTLSRSDPTPRRKFQTWILGLYTTPKKDRVTGFAKAPT